MILDEEYIEQLTEPRLRGEAANTVIVDDKQDIPPYFAANMEFKPNVAAAIDFMLKHMTDEQWERLRKACEHLGHSFEKESDKNS